jgi:hypothetical protein
MDNNITSSHTRNRTNLTNKFHNSKSINNNKFRNNILKGCLTNKCHISNNHKLTLANLIKIIFHPINILMDFNITHLIMVLNSLITKISNFPMG